LGTSTAEEGKEYFSNLGLHKKDFVWEDEQDGEAIELAFSKKKIEARKNWLSSYVVWRIELSLKTCVYCLLHLPVLISYFPFSLAIILIRDNRKLRTVTS